MRPVKTVEKDSLQTWRCRHCGYTYSEEDYLLPILRCQCCDSYRSFDRVTVESEYHPGKDLMLLP